jgi:hypothetical protein
LSTTFRHNQYMPCHPTRQGFCVVLCGFYGVGVVEKFFNKNRCDIYMSRFCCVYLIKIVFVLYMLMLMLVFYRKLSNIENAYKFKGGPYDGRTYYKKQ